MQVQNKSYRTVWWEEGQLCLIEQNVLPFEFQIFRSSDYRQSCMAIKTMIVRGAGAIGATAGFAMAQAIMENATLDFVKKAKKAIENTRPTAQNLFYATQRVFDKAMNSPNPSETALTEAQAIADEDAQSCAKIGEYGNTLIQNKMAIATHCNAGWLAFVDYGSALAPVYAAQKSGKEVFVYVDETRPRGQGARLTAWELHNQHVPCAVIPDNATAHYMANGKIQLMIVGADRIAKNGDVANKIGTLEKAIAAHTLGVPFYVAAPLATIDWDCPTGAAIPIEERSSEEVLYQTGHTKEGKLEKIRVAAPAVTALNPAFDVTPARFITGIITPKGIFKPEELSQLQKMG